MLDNKIKDFRKQKGLTQEQLSRKSGVSISNIKHYELGLTELKLANYYSVVNIAKALKVKPKDLFIED